MSMKQMYEMIFLCMYVQDGVSLMVLIFIVKITIIKISDSVLRYCHGRVWPLLKIFM